MKTDWRWLGLAVLILGTTRANAFMGRRSPWDDSPRYVYYYAADGKPVRYESRQICAFTPEQVRTVMSNITNTANGFYWQWKNSQLQPAQFEPFFADNLDALWHTTCPGAPLPTVNDATAPDDISQQTIQATRLNSVAGEKNAAIRSAIDALQRVCEFWE